MTMRLALLLGAMLAAVVGFAGTSAATCNGEVNVVIGPFDVSVVTDHASPYLNVPALPPEEYQNQCIPVCQLFVDLYISLVPGGSATCP